MSPRLLYMLTDPISTILIRGQPSWMRDHGFQVHVATGRGALLRPFAEREGVYSHEIRMSREPNALSDIVALALAVRLLRRVRPDVLNVSTPKAGLIGTLAGRAAHVPTCVYVVRGLRFETMTGVRRAAGRALERLTMRLAHHVIFNSTSLKSLAEEEHLIAKGRGIVIGGGSGNGLDVTRFDNRPTRSEARAELGLSQQAQVIGFVGRFTADKGIADAYQAFRIVADQNPAARLLLVGKYEGSGPFETSIRDLLQTDDRVINLGWLADLSLAYSAMDVLLFPSRREGLPNAPLEAQACDVPVVGYAATGTVDAVYEARHWLVPIGDIEGLVRHLTNLLENDDLRDRIGSFAREWVATSFAQEPIWRGLENYYREWLV